jgi:hypothetical protein
MSAAAMIEKGVDRDLYAVALEPEERDAPTNHSFGQSRRPAACSDLLSGVRSSSAVGVERSTPSLRR